MYKFVKKKKKLEKILYSFFKKTKSLLNTYLCNVWFQYDFNFQYISQDWQTENPFILKKKIGHHWYIQNKLLIYNTF